jgi:hypothetical protein
MKHDFSQQPNGEEADRFRAWLEEETIGMLQRSLGDAEGLKTTIILFVNRVYEAHMQDEEVGGIFGRCFVRAGFSEADEGFAFDTLEFLGEVAKRVHRTEG